MSVDATIFECSPDEIAAYIDGELAPKRELEMEGHFTLCLTCSHELNQQKQFLCGLNSTLMNEGELELPEGFTKLIVANAESTVSGLRRPIELYNAVFICVALLLFVLFALGAEAGNILNSVSAIFDQAGAVGGFFGRVVYSIFLGISIITRSIAAQFRIDVVIALAFVSIFAAFVLFVSRKMTDARRV